MSRGAISILNLDYARADSDSHEEHHIELWRIPNIQTLHHRLRPILLLLSDMRRLSSEDPNEIERVDVHPRNRFTIFSIGRKLYS